MNSTTTDADYLPALSILQKHGFGKREGSAKWDAIVYKHPTGAYLIDFGYGRLSLIDANEAPIFRLFIFSGLMLDLCLTGANLSVADGDEVAAQLAAIEAQPSTSPVGASVR